MVILIVVEGNQLIMEKSTHAKTKEKFFFLNFDIDLIKSTIKALKKMEKFRKLILLLRVVASSAYNQ